MGYTGKSNYEERDRLFEKSFQEKGANRNQVKKNLEDLFKPKPQVIVTPEKVQVKEDLCTKGHAWIRDWDGVYKCVRCKTPKPLVPKANSSV
jgi:hypothetical protein